MDERTIFFNALEKTNPHERAQYLEEACGENSQLRRQVDELLRASGEAGEFLESPPPGLVATIASGDFDACSVDVISLDFLSRCDKPGCLGRLGPYEVVDVVGRGGMGLVLRAFDPKLNRIVAIKVMAPEVAANPMAVKRFLREAKAAAAVSHDHVVTIHSIHDAERPPFLVMEFVDGKSLQEKIDTVGALELNEILRIGVQTAAGLAAAHKQGLVHRDIKPANILLENGVERVKITDFGLARTTDDVRVTQTGQIAGTPQYMSPEQAQGQPVDARSDLFSLGSVLYTMCTGRPPFRGDSAVAMLRRVCDDQPRPIREVNPEAPDWLTAIIAKLLAKHPDDRFQSAEEVADLLSRHLAHLQHPTASPMPPRIEPWDAPRWSERWGWYALAPLLGILVLLGGLVAGIWMHLDSNYGILVIESPVDDLEIERLRNGKVERVYDTLHGGGTQWHVPAGEWEFRIKGRNDYLLSAERIRFQRGSRVTIRIAPRSGGRSAATLTELVRLEGHEQYVLNLDFAPDGWRLVTGSGTPDNRVVLWDARNGRRLREFKGHSSSVYDVEASPDGRYIASAGKDRQIVLLDANTLQEVRRWKAHAGDIACLAFSPDSQLLASGSENWNANDGDVSVRVWDVKTGREAWRQDPPRLADGGHIHAITFSPKGEFLLTAHHSPDHRLSIWNSETGELVRRFGGLDSPISSVRYSPDGGFIAAGHLAVNVVGNLWNDPENCVVRIYEAATGEEVRKFTGHTGPIQSIDFSPNGKLLASGSGGQYLNDKTYENPSSDNSIRVWDVETGRELIRHYLPKPVKCVRFSRDGRSLATAAGAVGEKPDVQIWRLPHTVSESDAPPPAQITTAERLFIGDSDSGLFAVAISPDGEQAVSGHYSGEVRLWDIASGKDIGGFPVHTKTVRAILYWPAGRQMLTGSEDGSIRLWDVETGQELRQFRGHTGRVEQLALSPDGRLVASAATDYQGGEDNTVRLWDAESGEELRRVSGQMLFTRDLLFSRDGRHVYTAGLNSILQCEVETGQPVHRFPKFPTVPLCLALSPDGRLLAAGYSAAALQDGHWSDRENCVVRVWDLSSRTLLREFKGHTGPIVDIAFTADGQRLLSVVDGEHDDAGNYVPSRDNSMRLWEVSSGRELARYDPQERVRVLAIDPKGAGFLSGGESLRLWRLPE